MALHYTPDSIERLLCSPGVFVELPAADASHARPEIPCRYFDLTATEDTGHDILPDGSLRGLLKAYEDGHNILIALNRSNSEAQLNITRGLFQQLQGFCPSFDRLSYLTTLFVADMGKIDFPQPYVHTIQEGDRYGVELIYGIGYYDAHPRIALSHHRQTDGFFDWPLRRSLIYHKQWVDSVDTRPQCLWIVISVQSYLADFLVHQLRSTSLNKQSDWLKAHLAMHEHLSMQWRLPLQTFRDYIGHDFNQVFLIRWKENRQDIDFKWRELVNRAEASTKIDEAAFVAGVMAQSISQVFSRLPAKFALTESDEVIELAELQSLEYGNLKEEFSLLRRRVERNEKVYARLGDLRLEDLNLMSQSMQQTLVELKNANKDRQERTEKIKQRMDRDNYVAAWVGRCLGLLTTALLPVGIWGSFFSVTKIVDRSNWWYYWIAIILSWVVIVLLEWLGGVYFKLWPLRFWVKEPEGSSA